MDLWIRNQDKENLVKVELLELLETNGGCQIITLFQNRKASLGKYATKERALEVLNEIQRKIRTLLYLKPTCALRHETIEEAKKYHEKLNNQNFIISDNSFEIVQLSSNIIVYEMPEE